MGSTADKKFLMGPKGVLHRDPAHEDCNIDQIPRHRRRRFKTEHEAKLAGMRRRCEHCWPTVVQNPDTSDAESEIPALAEEPV